MSTTSNPIKTKSNPQYLHSAITGDHWPLWPKTHLEICAKPSSGYNFTPQPGSALQVSCGFYETNKLLVPCQKGFHVRNTAPQGIDLNRMHHKERLTNWDNLTPSVMCYCAIGKWTTKGGSINLCWTLLFPIIESFQQYFDLVDPFL